MQVKIKLKDLNKFCACGCGEKVTSAYSNAQKYICGHTPQRPKKDAEDLTHEIFLLYKNLIVDEFYARIIEIGVVSKNLNIKTQCWALKPKGKIGKRLPHYHDDYVKFSITIYGKVYEIGSHILMAMIGLGYVPSYRSQVNHDCDIKMCCNPSHLKIGRTQLNCWDTCNRFNDETNGHLLTRRQKNSIIYHIENGEHEEDIADAIGCSRSTVNAYAKGRRYLTTDGSEVLGETFDLIQIKKRRAVERLEERLDIAAAMMVEKENGDLSDNQLFKLYGLSFSTGRRYMKLLSADINPKYFNTPIQELLKAIDDNIDLSC